MEKLKIKAETREVGKKGLNRRLRKDGFIPAVLYGHGDDPMALSVNSKEFTTKIKALGLNVLIELDVPGGSQNPHVVMLKDYQTDSLKRKITHIDLLKINLKEKVTVKIPLKLVGKAVGLAKGGLVEQARRELEVECLPGNIPEVIEVDITELDVGSSLHINQIKLPHGVEVPHDVDFAIVSIVVPREEKVEEPAAAAPAEGAAAEGATAAAAPAEGEKKSEGDKKPGEKK